MERTSGSGKWKWSPSDSREVITPQVARIIVMTFLLLRFAGRKGRKQDGGSRSVAPWEDDKGKGARKINGCHLTRPRALDRQDRPPQQSKGGNKVEILCRHAQKMPLSRLVGGRIHLSKRGSTRVDKNGVRHPRPLPIATTDEDCTSLALIESHNSCNCC